MCGIICVFNNENVQHVNEIIKAHELLKNRGPDCGSLTINSKECLGFRRLCVNDTSVNGNQPFQLPNACGGVMKLLCNGEIYNHKELASKFKINNLQSGSDCEVLLRLYQKIGFEAMLEALDGVYAIVITDSDTVYLARDRIGVRPLYMGWTDDTKGDRILAVASVPSALQTFCTNIEQMPASSFIIYDKITREMRTGFHSLVLYKNLGEISVAEIQASIKHLLCDAVCKRLMTDRPMGCFLSGGIDSSIITSIIANCVGGNNVRTYAAGMAGATDLKYASIMANFLKTVHTEFIFTPEQAFDALPHVIRDIGSYDVTTVRASVGMWLLAKYVSDNSDDVVIFSGEGSDELLMGYLYFHYAPSPEVAQAESERLVKELCNYDVLRADRCVSSHGIELRVPFLDRKFVDLCLSIDPRLKMPGSTNRPIEKRLLRNAFSGLNNRNDGLWLPDEILWRRKEGFSDGTGSLNRPLSVCFQERICELISGPESPIVKEAQYYRQLFDEAYPNFQPVIPMWMPKWTGATDPSGRALPVFSNKIS